MTRDRKQKYWLKDLMWLSKVLVHGFRRALLNTGLSRQLQGSFSFSQARLSVTIHQVTARSSSALSTVRNEETETELQGSPADTLLQAGAHCTAGKEQGHQKHGAAGPAPIHSLSMQVAAPLSLDGLHWPVLSTIITIQRIFSVPGCTIPIIHTTQLRAIMSNNTKTQLFY